MNKKLKENIQRALRAELQKEGIFDVVRAGVGHYRLSGINSKIRKSSERLKKDWGKTKKYTEEKAEKMVSSKHQPVAEMGNNVKKNMTALDRAMQGTLEKLGSVVKAGASVSIPSFATEANFETWLENLGISKTRLSKGPGAEYGRIANAFIGLTRSIGDKVMTLPHEEYDKILVSKNKSLGDLIRAYSESQFGYEMKDEEIEEFIAAKNAAKNVRRSKGKLARNAAADEATEDATYEAKNAAKEELEQGGSGAKFGVQQLGKGGFKKKPRSIVSPGPAVQKTPNTIPTPPVGEPATPEPESDIAGKIKHGAVSAVGKWASDMIGGGVEGEAFLSALTQLLYDGFVKKKESKQGHALTPEQKEEARRHAEQQAQKVVDAKVGTPSPPTPAQPLPPTQEPEKAPAIPSEVPEPMTMADMFGVDKDGNVEDKEALPPPEINSDGDLQVGKAPGQTTTGAGVSGTTIAPPKTFKPKPKKGRASKKTFEKKKKEEVKPEMSLTTAAEKALDRPKRNKKKIPVEEDLPFTDEDMEKALKIEEEERKASESKRKTRRVPSRLAARAPKKTVVPEHREWIYSFAKYMKEV